MTTKDSPLTVMAFLVLPFQIAILYVRKIQIQEMLQQAHIGNATIWGVPGIGVYEVLGIALPMFQMIAFSVFFVMRTAQLRRRHSHLRKLAAVMWVIVSLAELIVCVAVPEHRTEAIVRFLVYIAPLMMMDNFGGAMVLEHLVCPIAEESIRWVKSRLEL